MSVLRKPVHDGVSSQGQHERHGKGYAYCYPSYVPAQNEGSFLLIHSYKMAYLDGTAMADGYAEEIAVHDEVDTIGAHGECFGAKHCDEESYDELRTGV